MNSETALEERRRRLQSRNEIEPRQQREMRGGRSGTHAQGEVGGRWASLSRVCSSQKRPRGLCSVQSALSDSEGTNAIERNGKASPLPKVPATNPTLSTPSNSYSTRLAKVFS